jgi:hypothetical protein
VDEDDTFHTTILRSCSELRRFLAERGEIDCYKPVIFSRWMTPDTAASPQSLATASGLLLGTLGAAMAAGALLGWAVGSWGIGLLVGAVVGIPLAVLVVYLVYSRREAA